MEEDSVSSKEESWSDDIEKLCHDVLFNVKQLQYAHKTNYIRLRRSLMWFRLPIIIISSANSVFSVGLTLYIDQQTVSIVNCMLSLICGIVSAIELFLGIQKGMDIELQSYHLLKLLAVRIAHQLKLDRCNRETTGAVFLQSIMSEYSQFIESSTVNGHEINDHLFEMRVPSSREGTLPLVSPRAAVSSPLQILEGRL